MAVEPKDLTSTGPEGTGAGIKGVEVHSIDWVPENKRHAKLWHQPIFWFLGDFQFLTIAIGFIGPSMGLSLLWTFVAGSLGILIGTFFMAFHGSQGPKMGLPQMVQSRAQFGYRGVLVPLVAVFVTYIGLNVVGQVLVAQGLSNAYGMNSVVVALASVIVGSLLAIFGHDWLHRAFQVLFVITVPLMVIISVAVLFGGAGSAVHSSVHYGFTVVAFMSMMGAAIAYNISYAVYVSDYSRYLPKNTKSSSVIASVFVGASASPIWLIAFGAWLAMHFGSTDALVGLKLAGNNVIPYLGTVTGILSALAIVAVTGMNGYGASLTILTAIDSVHKIRPTRAARVLSILAAAVIWYVIGASASQNAVNSLFTVLTLMLYLLIPWTATNLVDFFLVRKGRYAITNLFMPEGIYGAWNWRGLTAFAVGFLAEIPFMVLPTPFDFTGPAAKALSNLDISWIIGLIFTAATYWIVTRSLDVGKENGAIEASDRELHELSTSTAGSSVPLGDI
jgi:NCS1 family nucleobase:cation symporter-1